MPTTPTKNMDRLENTGLAWKTHAPDAKFYRITQAEYDAKIERSRDVRRRLEETRRVVAGLENERNDVDKENLELESNIANAISGDPDYGEDSTLWEATGRTRKSERARAGRKVVKSAGGK